MLFHLQIFYFRYRISLRICMLTYLVLGFLVVATYNAELTSYLTRSCFIHTFILQGLGLCIHLSYKVLVYAYIYLTRSCFIHTFILQGLVLCIHLSYKVLFYTYIYLTRSCFIHTFILPHLCKPMSQTFDISVYGFWYRSNNRSWRLQRYQNQKI